MTEDYWKIIPMWSVFLHCSRLVTVHWIMTFTSVLGLCFEGSGAT